MKFITTEITISRVCARRVCENIKRNIKKEKIRDFCNVDDQGFWEKTDVLKMQRILLLLRSLCLVFVRIKFIKHNNEKKR